MSLTKSKLLSSIRGQREAKQSHGRDENTGNNEIEEVVEGSPANVDSKGDINIGLGAAVVGHRILFTRHPWIQQQWNLNLVERDGY